jgi:hypothetical protein
MRFGYGMVSTGFTSVSRRVALALSMCFLPALFWVEIHAGAKPAPEQHRLIQTPPAPQPDPRVVRLVRYFSKLNCPVSNLAHVFVKAADDNRLDWRLLPSISVIESGGGKAYKNNNIFGWDSGLQAFSSISSGIEVVAARLGRSPLYRNRDSAGKLRVYNPNESYVHDVMTVMNRISPVVDLASNRPAPVLTQRD